MHMADALLAPAVAATMYAASTVTAVASIVKLNREEKLDHESAAKKLPTMAVMSALVFAGQMINYTIPDTGSSGHICGGMLLTSVLGPWAGFLSMIAVLAIQCLFFAASGRFIRYKLSNVSQAALKYPAQLIECVCAYVPILSESVQLTCTYMILFYQLVLRNILFF